MKLILKNKIKAVDELPDEETLSVFTAGTVIAKSPSRSDIKDAIKIIKSAIDAGSITVNTAVEFAKARGDKDEALLLALRRFIVPVQLFEDEKQTIMTKSCFLNWLHNTERSHLIKSQSLESGLPPSEESLNSFEMDQDVLKRINAMITVYKEMWAKTSEGDLDIPKNPIIAGRLQDHCDVSDTMALKMASIVRPSWGSGPTGGR